MLSRAINATDDGVYITNREGRILFANQALLGITGLSMDELLGSTTRVFKSGEMSDAYYCRLWETVLGGRVWREIITNRRGDGELYEASQTITPVRNEDGEVDMMIAVQRDITRQQELAAEVREMQTEVERLLSEKETLLKEVYHRVKNDMSLTRSLLNLQAQEAEVPEAREALSRAADRVGVLGRMYSLMQYESDATSVEAPTLFSQVVDGLRASVGDTTVTIDTDVEEVMVGPRAATVISMITNELAMNASKYAFPSTEAPGLTLSFRSVGDNRVQLTVRDNGPGFPPEVIEDRTYGFGSVKNFV
jgi:PAS domain S-box-containing protein